MGNRALRAVAPWFRSLLRIVIGFTFTLHGIQKLFGAFGGIAGNRVYPFSMMGLAGFLETFGGILIILGLFTTPVALILCGEMAYAYTTVHAPRGHFPIQNGGELAILYAAIFLYFFVAGPGPFSMDRLLRFRNRPAAKTEPQKTGVGAGGPQNLFK